MSHQESVPTLGDGPWFFFFCMTSEKTMGLWLFLRVSNHNALSTGSLGTHGLYMKAPVDATLGYLGNSHKQL